VRPRSNEFGDAIRDLDLLNSEMHLEAVIKRVWKITGMPRFSELRHALRGFD
jgi:hypothetical protein